MLDLHQVSLIGEGFLVADVNGLVVQGYLDSDHTIAQFFVLPYPSTGCTDPSYVPNWLLGWEMKMGNRVHTETHIYPVGICIMTCRGISEMGT